MLGSPVDSVGGAPRFGIGTAKTIWINVVIARKSPRQHLLPRSACEPFPTALTISIVKNLRPYGEYPGGGSVILTAKIPDFVLKTSTRSEPTLFGVPALFCADLGYVYQVLRVC